MNITVTVTAPVRIPAQPDRSERYGRPGLPSAGRPVRRIGHETDRGFCSVCGAVWPCARARREQRSAADPFDA